MRPKTIQVTGVGTSAWIPVDWYKLPINISLHATVSGTVTSTIEYTVSDVYDPAVTPIAFPVTGMSGLTANTAGNIAFPIRAVRINNTAGTGTLSLTIMQSRTS